MAGKKPERSESITFRVSADEKRLIEKLAAKGESSVSQYVLSCILMDMFTSGDVEAMKHAVSMLGVGAREAFRSLLHGKEKE